MRDLLPKIIGGVVVVVVIGGTAMMVTRHKGPVTPSGTAAVVVPPPVAQVQPAVQEVRKYKRDMLDYTPDTTPSKTAVTTVPEKPVAVDTGRAKLQLDKIAHEIKLESSQMKPSVKISLYYTCNGKNVSPPLNWSHAPTGTKSYVVMMEGPNSGHGEPLQWAIYNMPASQEALPEALPKLPVDDKGVGQAQTDVGPVGYSGPCIPKGQFTFVFSVYALDTDLKLHGGATRNELINAMNGHIIDMATLPVSHYFRL